MGIYRELRAGGPYTTTVKRSKTALIVGASGFIGSSLALRLREEFKVYGTYFRHPFRIPGVTPIKLDAAIRDDVKRIVYSISPEIVIYAGGRNDVIWAEDSDREADRVHANGPVNVVTTAGILQPRFIFLSNNYVFDGRKGNYVEDDIVLPVYNLGKNKLSSEKYFMGTPNFVIVRSAPVYGRGIGLSLSFLDKVRVMLSKGIRLDVSNNELFNYAPVHGLVDMIANLVDGGPRNVILHYGGLTKIGEYDFIKAFAERFGLPTSSLTMREPQTSEFVVSSTLDYSLNFTKAVEALRVPALSLEDGLELFAGLTK